jgi:hypothetical protein
MDCGGDCHGCVWRIEFSSGCPRDQMSMVPPRGVGLREWVGLWRARRGKSDVELTGEQAELLSRALAP